MAGDRGVSDAGHASVLEQFLGREPPRAKVGRLHRSLDAAQNRLEFRAISLMSLRARWMALA